MTGRTHRPKIDAVLPLLAADLDRARILLDSLPLVRDLGTCWIVVPDAEWSALASQLQDRKLRSIPESAVVPELRTYRRLRRLRPRGDRTVSGWYVQQLIKMAMAEIVETDFYLTLDADVICVKSVGYDDLVKDGRAISQRTTENRHPSWYRRAERVLQLPRSRFNHGVTPALLSREAMLALHRHLEARVSPLFRWVGRVPSSPFPSRNVLTSWRSYLMRHLPWTEYSLYGTFVEAAGLYEKYHWDGGPEALYENSVWNSTAFDSWDPCEIVNYANSYFCVVQSTAGIDPVAIRTRLEKLGACT